MTAGPCLHDAPLPFSEMAARTDAGAQMVALAERVGATFRESSLRHDRSGTFASEHLARLRDEGFLVGPVPSELGGGGVMSVHDVLVAVSRLARTDAATTIGVSMHLVAVLNVVRLWRVACRREESGRAAELEAVLRRVVTDDLVFAAAISEPAGQDLARPSTTATETGDGWTLAGRKRFATMASAATLLNVAVTFVRDGEERYGFATVPADAPGVEFHDDWDAVGMRASASGSVTFHDVRLPRSGVRDAFPVGELSAAMVDRYLASGAFHAAASLGIAEGAHAAVVSTLRSRSDDARDAHTVMRLSENEIDLTTMRATLGATGDVVDRFQTVHADGELSAPAAWAAYARVQAAKTHLNDAAVRVTDRAMALSGGAGYMSSSPLGKAWRDARAGAFMHPVGANRAHELIARVTLGLEPRAN